MQMRRGSGGWGGRRPLADRIRQSLSVAPPAVGGGTLAGGAQAPAGGMSVQPYSGPPIGPRGVPVSGSDWWGGSPPAGGTPAGGMVGGTPPAPAPAPVGGTPVGGTPVGGTPVGGTPVGGTPADAPVLPTDLEAQPSPIYPTGAEDYSRYFEGITPTGISDDDPRWQQGYGKMGGKPGPTPPGGVGRRGREKKRIQMAMGRSPEELEAEVRSRMAGGLSQKEAENELREENRGKVNEALSQWVKDTNWKPREYPKGKTYEEISLARANWDREYMTKMREHTALKEKLLASGMSEKAAAIAAMSKLTDFE